MSCHYRRGRAFQPRVPSTAARTSFSPVQRGPTRFEPGSSTRVLVELYACHDSFGSKGRKYPSPIATKTEPAIPITSTFIGLSTFQIGRASCRERGGQYVLITVVAVSLKKKTRIHVVSKMILNTILKHAQRIFKQDCETTFNQHKIN